MTSRRNRIHTIISAAMSGLGLLACATATAPLPSPVPSVPPIVAVDGERLQGAYSGNGSTDVVFRGIPYAAPPLGDLRWKPPMPITPRPGLSQATEYGPACIQTPNNAAFYRNIAQTLGHDPMEVSELPRMNEDCLYLNVWTRNHGSKNLLPVMVWIHGGANAAGTAVAVQTDGASLARKGVVVVSFNYRVNAFGFLAHPALTAESDHGSSGNYALLDQIAALQWVQRNIAAFGGDPGRVTVFGQSAGGTDIAYLLASPLAKDLFHGAVIQSAGYAVSDFRSHAEAEGVGMAFAENLGLKDSTDVLSSMRSKSADDVFRAWLVTKGIFNNAPNVDGWVLPAVTARRFEEGKHNRVPLLVGFNRDEWTSLRRYWPNVTVDGFQQVLRTVYGTIADRAIALYPATTDAEAVTAADRWQTDWYYACPSRFISHRMARVGDKVYFYLFSRAVPGPGGDQLGAYHAAEIPYVWDTLASETWVAREPWDQKLADAMSGAWVRFAATGDPNGGGLPPWPAYNREEGSYLEFGDEIRVGSGIRKDYCETYEDLQAFRLANSPQ